MKKEFPDGLIEIQIASQEFDAEYKGVADCICNVCSLDEKCNVFNIISDIENFPDYKDYCTLSFGLSHTGCVKVVG